MGSLPQHSVIEFRRYMNRFLYLFPDLSDMRGVMRTPVNQYQFFIEPLVAWLRPRGVNFLTDTFVRDIGFAAAPARTTVNRLDYERRGTVTSVWPISGIPKRARTMPSVRCGLASLWLERCADCKRRCRCKCASVWLPGSWLSGT
jgi:hypothetical protein